MKISQDVKESAVARIFRKNRVTKENGRLLLSDVTAEWYEMGLRKEDLTDGLRELVDSGVLVSDQIEGLGGLTLTSLGQDYLGKSESVSPFARMVNQAHTLLMLKRARRRKHPHDVQQTERRHGR